MRLFKKSFAKKLSVTLFSVDSVISIATEKGQTTETTLPFGIDNLTAIANHVKKLIDQSSVLLSARIILAEQHTVSQTITLETFLSDEAMYVYAATQFTEWFGESAESHCWDVTLIQQKDDEFQWLIVAASAEMINDICQAFRAHNITLDQITTTTQTENINLLPWRQEKNNAYKKWKRVSWVLASALTVVLITVTQLSLMIKVDHLKKETQSLQELLAQKKSMHLPDQSKFLKKLRAVNINLKKSGKINAGYTGLLRFIEVYFPQSLMLNEIRIHNNVIEMEGTGTALNSLYFFINQAEQYWKPYVMQPITVQTDEQHLELFHFVLQGSAT